MPYITRLNAVRSEIFETDAEFIRSLRNLKHAIFNTVRNVDWSVVPTGKLLTLRNDSSAPLSADTVQAVSSTLTDLEVYLYHERKMELEQLYEALTDGCPRLKRLKVQLYGYSCLDKPRSLHPRITHLTFNSLPTFDSLDPLLNLPNLVHLDLDCVISLSEEAAKVLA